MIQFDTNSPETGQAVPQGIRNSLSEKGDEESIEFSQIWSELVEHDSPKAPAPSFTQSPVATKSDAALDEISPDAETTEVQTERHAEETEPFEWVGTQTTKPPRETSQTVPANDHPIPRARQLPATNGALDQTQILESGDHHAGQTPYVGKQPATSTEVSETTVLGRRATNQDDPFNRTPMPLWTSEASAAPLEAVPATTRTADAPLPNSTTPELGSSNGPLQTGLLSGRKPLQTVTHDHVSKDRPPSEGGTIRAENIPAEAAKHTAQMATPSAPVQVTVQPQRSPPSPARPPQEQSRGAQSVTPPSTLAPSKVTSTPVPTVPVFELTNPMPIVALETELPAIQPLSTSVTNASATVAPPSNAPQVAAQIVAAVSQSSGSTTEILLNPEELGRVRISLTNGDAGITVNILTERAETADLMRRNIELLARDLRDLGYENPSFTFDERSGGAHDTWQDEQPETSPDNPNNTPEPPTPSMHVAMTGGLDLKL